MSAEDIIQPTNPLMDWKTQPTTSSGVYSSVGTIMLPSPYPMIAINDEHERNEFARAALTGILANQAEVIPDKEAVEWAFEIADRMMKASKSNPQLPN